MHERYNSHKSEREEIVESALVKIEKNLADTQINPVSFADLYDPVQIQKDIEYTATMREKQRAQGSDVDRRNFRMAKAFEGIMLFHGEQSNWFGDNATTIHTSEYDDIANGVDGVVEYEEDGSVSRMAMAFDVTYSTNLYRKFSGIKDSIQQGKLATIKYFESEDTDTRAELKQVPRLIVGAESNVVEELALLWLDGKNKELSEHSIQFQTLEMIYFQAEYFAKYALSVNREDFARKYENIARIVRDVLDQKEEDGIVDNGTRDEVYNSLMSQISNAQ